MNKKWLLVAALAVSLLVIGHDVGQAQTPAPASILVCSKKPDGAMVVVQNATDCKDKGTVITFYTQDGVDAQIAALGSRLDSAETTNASLNERIAALESRLASAETAITSLDGQVEQQANRITALEGTLAGMAGEEARLAALENLLVHFHRNGNEITISGANLNIVNGMGSTETTNGLGNLVIGYNELQVLDGACSREICFNTRTGSHMLVIGKENNFSSYGGIVSGQHNFSGAPFASVTGGIQNFAKGSYSTITGGSDNSTEGPYSSIGGGQRNQIEGSGAFFSTICGGNLNVVQDGHYDTVVGNLNWLRGSYQWAVGSLTGDDSDRFIGFPP